MFRAALLLRKTEKLLIVTNLIRSRAERGKRVRRSSQNGEQAPDRAQDRYKNAKLDFSGQKAKNKGHDSKGGIGDFQKRNDPLRPQKDIRDADITTENFPRCFVPHIEDVFFCAENLDLIRRMLVCE